ncbi:PRC-barrel domain-containing protein [Tropicimonas isoalkanivorans]|uniref:PRC-barrel domain-containing protein n=1 Tax=Tropicimonas isoalkanivorans TaxID=441112 RepID=A0A1I1PKV5_9RHOB|nr:PRC-barrel domain-containing protein [Tropicimonas isoalkanivorans]SFD10287.1 PRC-barrel domain-containing protein [Tropicimonas isoalkanivorans]
MKRILTSTAIVMLAAMPFFLQDAATAEKPEVNAEASANAQADAGISMEQDGMTINAADLIGHPVYVGAEGEATVDEAVADVPDGWERAGEIGDVILTSEGGIESITMDIGGFLGMGEKNVQTSMDNLKFVQDSDEEGEYFIVFTGDRSKLEMEEEYDRAALDEDSYSVYSERPEMAAQQTSTEMEQETEQAAAETKQEVEQTADAAEQNMEKAGNEAEQELEQAANETEQEVEQTAEAAEQNMEQTADAAEKEMEQTADAAEQNVDAAEPVATDTAAVDPAAQEPAANNGDSDRVLTAEELDGMPVIGSDGDRLGEVSDIVLTDSGEIDSVIIDVGGFLGLGEKPVAIPFSELTLQEGEGLADQTVKINRTEEELEQMERWEG